MNMNILPSDIFSQSFGFFIAKVRDLDDPLKLGRVRISLIGHHDLSDSVQNEELPWATPLMSLTDGPYINGRGRAPVGVSIGSLVIGFFLDAKAKRTPMLLGTWATMSNMIEDQSQVPDLARGKESLNQDILGPEPKSSFNAQYPFNDAKITRSGHVIEFDDTPESERIRIRHKSGSYFEMNQKGDFIHKASNDSYDIVVKDKIVYIGGDVSLTVKGSVDASISGPVSIKSENVTWEVE
jgi:hypothetical protein